LSERTYTVKHVKRHLQVVAIVIAVLVAMGTWTPAAAQPPSADRVLDKISFGWKFYRLSQSSFSEVFPLGFYFDASGDLGALEGWDWIGEVTYTRKSETVDDIFGEFEEKVNILFVAGGLKREFVITNPRLLPHCQGLIGFARISFSAEADGEELGDDSETKFALKGSCAVDYVLNDRWDLRGGAGFIRVFTEEIGTNIFRLFVGAVYKFE
jgi:hypothetical protein